MISLNNGHQLPIVGQTRCYWTLLSPALHFLALDPVLAFHLQEQAPLIINRSLLDFVHPEELSYARHDLSSVLRDRTLHGSITRVRYSRLSRVRRLLGFHPSPTSPLYPPSFPAERIAVDENYMAVDIVINWAAEGVVLCFIHAVVDLKPDEDNDEKHKTGWSNWCGTPVFDEKHAGHMFQSLKDAIPDPVSLPYPSDDPSLRVFQILRNGSDKQLLLNWPSELMISEYPYVNSTFTDALARLVDHVQINYGQNSDVNKSNYNSNATTSCTRRYRSFQTLNVPFGQISRAVQVESVFVPHGSVIFACHKVDGILSNGGLDSRANTQRPTSDLGWVLGQPEENKPRMYTTDPSPFDPELMGGNGYSMRTTQNQPQSWMQLPDNPLRLPELDHNGHPGLDHNVYTKHSSSPVSSQDDMWSRHTSALGSSSARTGFNTSTSQLSTPQSLPQAPSPINATAQGSSPSNGSRTGSSKRSCSPDETPKPPPSGPSWTQNALSEKSTASSSTVPRNVTKPPIGVLRCASCKTTNSPEWRKGPSGKKELCNACGLRYARSRARKEGVTPRRRKDKFIAFSSLQQPTPSTTAQLPSANGFDAQHLPVESSQYNGTRYEDSMSRTTTDPVALVQRDGSTLNSNEALYQSRAAGSATPDLSSSVYRSDYSQVAAGGVKASDTSSYYDSDSEARGYSGADSNRVILMHGTPTTSGGHLDHSSSYSQMTTSASYPPYSNGYSHSLTHAHSNTSLDSQYLCDCQTPGVDASRLSCRGYH